MGTQQKNDVRISGAGKIAGGVYETVSIAGAGKINGDVEAERIRISGAGKVGGNVKAGEFSASGAAKIDGDVAAGKFKCSGAVKIAGGITAETFRASGGAKVGGCVKAGDARISGSGRFGGDVTAERFQADGAFDIDGLLNADEIDITLQGGSRVREIGGSRIDVYCGLLRRGRPCELTAQSIEGDQVHLESTKADVVRGREVVIDPFCRIRRVEYDRSLQIDPKAEVAQQVYTGDSDPPPPVRTDPVELPDRPEGRGVHLQVRLGSHEIHNPVARALVGVLGLLLAVAILGTVFCTVFPAVGVLLVVVFGGVCVLLAVLTVGIPAILVGTLVVKLALLPFALIRRITGSEHVATRWKSMR